MKCNLCLKEKKLIKKSHLIPDFLYKGIYDDDHFIHKLDLKNPERSGKVPSSIYDKHILCRECDGEIISSYETYGSLVVYGDKKERNSSLQYEKIPPNTLLIKDIDYGKFKLFLLSILWRAHISKNDFFKEVDLGPYAERLRKMILHGNPGEDDEFETCLIYYNEKSLPSSSVINPRKIKQNGNSCYHFLINDLGIYYNISADNKLEFFNYGGLKSNNTMKMYVATGSKAKDLFKKSTGFKLEL